MFFRFHFNLFAGIPASCLVSLLHILIMPFLGIALHMASHSRVNIVPLQNLETFCRTMYIPVTMSSVISVTVFHLGYIYIYGNTNQANCGLNGLTYIKGFKKKILYLPQYLPFLLLFILEDASFPLALFLLSLKNFLEYFL